MSILNTNRHGSRDNSTCLIQFPGTFDRHSEYAQLFSASISFHRWDPTSLNVTLAWIGEGTPRDKQMRLGESIHSQSTWLYASVPHSHCAELIGISQTKTDGQGAQISAIGVEYGITDEPEGEDIPSGSVLVKLQPSGILCFPGIRTTSYTGDIETKKIGNDEIKFDTDFGALEVRETYEYDYTIEHGNEITKRIKRASMLGSIKVNKGQSIKDIHTSIKEDVDLVTVVLSLCYRQPVEFYEIEYRLRGGDRRLHRKKLHAAREMIEIEELINSQSLASGGLQELASRLRDHPQSKVLIRTIRFLAASRVANLEEAYFLAFSATEALISAALPESIRRLRFAQRVENLLSTFSPSCALWSGKSVAEGLKKAAQTRHSLFHAAEVSNPADMLSDLYRLRVFSELLILHLLGWPRSKMAPRFDNELKGWEG